MTGARGTNALEALRAPTRRRGSTTPPESSSPAARLAETAIARETAARRRRARPHALSPSPCLSPRSRSIDDAEHRLRQVRGPPRVQLCWHISERGGGRRRFAAALCKESHLSAPARRPDDDPAVPSARGTAGVPGPRGAVEELRGGAPFSARCGRAAAMQPRARAGRDFQ